MFIFNGSTVIKLVRKLLKVIIFIAYFMFSGRMLHSAAVEVSNKRFLYFIVMFPLCTSVLVEAYLNDQVG